MAASNPFSQSSPVIWSVRDSNKRPASWKGTDLAMASALRKLFFIFKFLSFSLITFWSGAEMHSIQFPSFHKSFLRSPQNKKTSKNLIEQHFIRENKKIRNIFKRHCPELSRLRVSSHNNQTRAPALTHSKLFVHAAEGSSLLLSSSSLLNILKLFLFWSVHLIFLSRKTKQKNSTS